MGLGDNEAPSVEELMDLEWVNNNHIFYDEMDDYLLPIEEQINLLHNEEHEDEHEVWFITENAIDNDFEGEDDDFHVMHNNDWGIP